MKVEVSADYVSHDLVRFTDDANHTKLIIGELTIYMSETAAEFAEVIQRAADRVENPVTH